MPGRARALVVVGGRFLPAYNLDIDVSRDEHQILSAQNVSTEYGDTLPTTQSTFETGRLVSGQFTTLRNPAISRVSMSNVVIRLGKRKMLCLDDVIVDVEYSPAGSLDKLRFEVSFEGVNPETPDGYRNIFKTEPRSGL